VEFWTDYRHENTPEVTEPEVARLADGHDETSNRRLVDLYRELYERTHGVQLEAATVPIASTPTTTTSTAAKVIQ